MGFLFLLSVFEWGEENISLIYELIQDTLESTFQARVSADFSQTQKGHCLSFHLQVYYHHKYSIEEKIELMALVDCHLS